MEMQGAKQVEKAILDSEAVARAVAQLAEQIEKCKDAHKELSLLAVKRGGIALAGRLRPLIERAIGRPVPYGELDIGLYRDDHSRALPVIGPTNIPFSLEGGSVILVDDVLFTGRTIRAALNEMMDFGRPRRVFLAVLVDRGGRELPIQADFVGTTVDCPASHRVMVSFTELDGRDGVFLREKAQK